jgi:hypothetical protein
MNSTLRRPIDTAAEGIGLHDANAEIDRRLTESGVLVGDLA